jgi:hypothetical protein
MQYIFSGSYSLQNNEPNVNKFIKTVMLCAYFQACQKNKTKNCSAVLSTNRPKIHLSSLSRYLNVYNPAIYSQGKQIITNSGTTYTENW